MKVWWIDIRHRGWTSLRVMIFYYENLRVMIIKVRGNKRVRAKYLFSHYHETKALTDNNNIEPERLKEVIPKCQGYFEID